MVLLLSYRVPAGYLQIDVYKRQVSTVLNIIYVFNSFPIIWTITKGDPASRTDTLVTYLYKLAFYKGKSGEAAAVSVIGFLILCICASVYMVLSLRKEDED